jgi:hypothetical protein
MKIKVIITGSTGMVGEGVLVESLQHPDVDKVLVINRKPCNITHPKLIEIIHPDFYDLSPIADKLKGYDGCFFCLGKSSLGMKPEDYYSVTYTLTMHIADVLLIQNPGMVFCYISGAGTDSSEKGRLRWARVKGKTENDLIKMPFRRVYAFRPGLLHPSADLKNVNKYYKYIRFLYPVLRTLFPGSVSTLKELGDAMINSVTLGYEKNILEVRDILKLAGI